MLLKPEVARYLTCFKLWRDFEGLVVLASQHLVTRNLEFDDCFNQTGVELKHLLVLLGEEALLNVVTRVMKPASPNIGACPLQSVSQLFHVFVVPQLI